MGEGVGGGCRTSAATVLNHKRGASGRFIIAMDDADTRGIGRVIDCIAHSYTSLSISNIHNDNFLGRCRVDGEKRILVELQGGSSAHEEEHA